MHLRNMNRKVSFIIYRSYERQTIVLDWYLITSPNFRERDTHWSFPVFPLELPVRPSSPGPIFRRSSPGPAAVFGSIPDPVPGWGQAGSILLIWSSSLLTLRVVRLTILPCSKKTKLIRVFNSDNQCCGSGFIEPGSGSRSISSESGVFDDQKLKKKKNPAENW